MHETAHFVRRYPLSVLCLALIALLSFTPFFPETPLDDVEFIDKWTHLVMYGGTSAVIWWEYLRNHHAINWHRLLWIAVVGMIVLGGVIELAQKYGTTTRSGEWLDFIADTVGVLIGSGLGCLMYISWHKRKHG
jgi:VanZ family protein